MTVKEAKKIWVYDNGGTTLDRFTIIDKENPTYHPVWLTKYYNTVISSETGAGVYLHDEIASSQIGKHLGKRIQFCDLDKGVQNAYINDFNS